jgi:hypothetical protein
MKCVLVGSSHAALLNRPLQQFSKKLNFHFETFSQPGATYEQLRFPNPDVLSESDILVVIPFGNDVFEKNSHEITRTAKGKIIHLKRYAPTSDTVLKGLFTKLQQRLDKYKCRKYVLDSFLKYVDCCQKHTIEYPKSLNHQKKTNKRLVAA